MFWIKYYEKIMKGYIDKTEEMDYEYGYVDNKPKNFQKPKELSDYLPIEEEETKDLIEFLIARQRKYVQDNYKQKSHEVYAKYFLGRIKDVHSDDNKYGHDIDKEEFIDAISTLKSYHINESVTSKTKFPLIYGIISIYTTFILEEPIHPVGTPFPGSLYVEEKDGKFYCPVKDANLESPNAVCKMCLAEQLEF
jgi:uncharacterized protein (UPF0305 family)